MTTTLQPPSTSSMPPRRPSTPRRRGLPRVGAAAALKAAAYGLLALGLPTLLVWATDPRAGAGLVDALRVVGQLWLVAGGASLEVGDGRFALTPLALCALPLLLLWRVGTAASREAGAQSVGAAARVALAVAVPYAALSVGVALASATDTVHPSLPSSALSALVLALLGAGAGALRPDRLWRAAQLRVPAPVRRTAPAVLGACALLAAGGALLVGGSLAAHGSRAADLAGATAPGPVGGIALLLLGLVLVPNAVVFGASWLAGPGFAVGAGTAVGPFAHALGPVPAVPLLAALPGSGVPTWAGVLALAVPVAAGVVAGRLLPRGTGTARACGDALLAAVLAGTAWAVLAWVAGGATGGQRLVTVGPSPWQVGLAVAAEVAVGALLAVLVLRRRATGD